MADPKIIDEWLRLAKEDFEFARRNLADPSTTSFGPICFHFQQAAEKYLKAFIVARNLKFEKVHDLDALRLVCMESEPAFESIKEQCLFLSDFYLEARYPLIVPTTITREDAECAQRSAEKIKDLVLKFLTSEPSVSR